MKKSVHIHTHGKQSAKDYTYYYSKLRRQALEFALDVKHIVLPENIRHEDFKLSLHDEYAKYVIMYQHDTMYYTIIVRYRFKLVVDINQYKSEKPIVVDWYDD